MENKRLLHALGICAKARALVCGTPMVCEALKSGARPRLVIEADGNSENTAKRIADRCAFYGVELWRTEIDGDTLARAIGKSGRVAVVAVSDENLCKLLRSAYGEAHS